MENWLGNQREKGEGATEGQRNGKLPFGNRWSRLSRIGLAPIGRPPF